MRRGDFWFLASGADHQPSAKEQVWKTLLLPIIGLSRNAAKNQKDRWLNYPTRTAITFLKML